MRRHFVCLNGLILYMSIPAFSFYNSCVYLKTSRAMEIMIVWMVVMRSLHSVPLMTAQITGN